MGCTESTGISAPRARDADMPFRRNKRRTQVCDVSSWNSVFAHYEVRLNLFWKFEDVQKLLEKTGTLYTDTDFKPYHTSLDPGDFSAVTSVTKLTKEVIKFRRPSEYASKETK